MPKHPFPPKDEPGAQERFDAAIKRAMTMTRKPKAKLIHRESREHKSKGD